MMGCSNNGNEVNTSDSSINGRKLKPLMPRPTITSCASSKKASMSFAITTHHHPYIPNCTLHASSADLLAFNHRLAERYKKDFEAQQQLLASTISRWNPTPQQLLALEDIYRRGTRTPSPEQIQQIATELRRFGNIEGKNVFYWFQNHKARERQKRRRVSESTSVMEQQQQGHVGSLEKTDSGLRRTSFEVGQTRYRTPPSNCSTHSEEPVSIHRAAVVAENISADGLIQLQERELPQRRNTVEKHDTRQMMELLSCSPTTQYIINTITTTTTEALTTTLEKKSPTNNQKNTTKYNEDHETIEDQSQTLELFPLRSDDHCGVNYVRENHTITNFSTPIQFFEFLPLKN